MDDLVNFVNARNQQQLGNRLNALEKQLRNQNLKQAEQEEWQKLLFNESRRLEDDINSLSSETDPEKIEQNSKRIAYYYEIYAKELSGLFDPDKFPALEYKELAAKCALRHKTLVDLQWYQWGKKKTQDEITQYFAEIAFKEKEQRKNSANRIIKFRKAAIGLVVILGFVYYLLPLLGFFDPFDTAPRRLVVSDDYEINHSATTISQLGNENGTFYVTGSVKNISNSNFQQVELKIEVYDGQGTLLGETLDYTNQLGPKVTWNFKAACLLTNAASAKVIGVIARK
ncbi:MAG: FxLYD domain-containing protein [Limisphaerales bacterium]